MPAVIKVVEGRTVIQAGENTAEAARQANRAVAAEAGSVAASVIAMAMKDLAELAALTAPNVFETTAAGLGAVGEGETFWTEETDGPTLFRKVSGVAEELDSILSRARLAAPDGAGQIGYKLPGINTVERDAAAKLSDFRCVEDWGVRGDSEGPAVDESALIQEAIDETNGDLWFRSGVTYLAQGLVPHDNLTLRGGATIRPPVDQTDHVIHYNSAVTLYDFNIEGLIFIGRGTSTYDAIHITSPTPAANQQVWNESSLNRVQIRDFRQGIYCPTPRSVRIRDCHVHLCLRGIVWDWEHFYIILGTVMFNAVGLYVGHGTPIGTGIHHFRIIGTAIAHNTTAGILGNMSSGSIALCSLIDNGLLGHLVSEGMNLNMRVGLNRFEKGSGTPYAITTASGTIERMMAYGNVFISMAVADFYGSFARCSIVGNLSRSCGGNFFKNTGGSTADMTLWANQVNECERHAYELSGVMLGIDIHDKVTDAGRAAFAADPANDALALPRHGLSTGAPVKVASLGESAAPPAPLVAGTTYYVISVDADTIKLAASEADATAGTAINLTSAGTGFHFLTGAYSGIRVLPGASLFHANFNDSGFRNVSTTQFMKHAVDLTGVTTLEAVKVKDLTCRNLASPLSIATTFTAISDGKVIIDSCDGTVSENSGPASITAGLTSVVVNHGLSYQPAASRISVTPTSNLGGSCFWVSNVTATQFTINISAPIGTNAVFAWSARLRK